MAPKLSALRNPDNWQRRASTLQKQFVGVFRHRCDSKPIFVLGKQRSGTTMLMHAFHRCPDVLVFDEHRDNKAFEQHRLRSFNVIRNLVEQSRFPAVCFKPICDSHRITDLIAAFPDAHCIWIYRDYRDVANSSLRKFETSVRAIRLVCTGKSGGGWFQEGVSRDVSEVLRKAYRPGLTDFDLACLSWWARNQIIFESKMIGKPNVTVMRYEALVCDPEPILQWLFDRIGLEHRARVGLHISPRSIGRHHAPEIDSTVRSLCAEALMALDDAYCSANPPGNSSWRHKTS